MDGNNSRILRVAEATWGTTPASDMVVIPIMECGFGFKQGFNSQTNRQGSTWNPTKPGLAPSDCSGALRYLLNGLAHGFTLADFLTVSTTGPVDVVYTHTMKITTPPIGASFEAGSPTDDLYDLFAGMRCTSLAMKGSAMGGIEVTQQYSGKHETQGTSSNDASPTSYADTPFELGVALGATTLAVQVGGVDVATLLDFEFTATRPAGTPARPFGSLGKPGNMPLRHGEIRGRMSFQFVDFTRYAAAKAGTETSLKIGVGVGAGDGTSGDEHIEILLPEILMERVSPNLISDDGVVEDYPFVAYYSNASEATALQIILKNTIATIA